MILAILSFGDITGFETVLSVWCYHFLSTAICDDTQQYNVNNKVVMYSIVIYERGKLVNPGCGIKKRQLVLSDRIVNLIGEGKKTWNSVCVHMDRKLRTLNVCTWIESLKLCMCTHG